MIFEHLSYRSYLKAVLVDRTKKNPAYSMRAMAKQVGFSCSQLSEAMNDKANFSVSSLRKLAKKLGLNVKESAYLCSLGELEAEKDPEHRETILQALSRMRPGGRPIHDFSLDYFKQISDWYHSVILELVYLPSFEFTPENIAKCLEISKAETDLALERLLRLELLQKDEDGKYYRPQSEIMFRSPERNIAMRNFYRQMMVKTSEALESQAPGERWSGYETFPFSAEAMPELEKVFEEFFEKVVQVSKKYPESKTVYHFVAHFFNLTPKLSLNRSKS